MAFADTHTIGLNNAGYVQSMSPAPRELGAIERIGGLVSGIDDLRGRLQHLIGRLDVGQQEAYSNTARPVAPRQPGLEGGLSDAESTLRDCFDLVQTLTNRL